MLTTLPITLSMSSSSSSGTLSLPSTPTMLSSSSSAAGSTTFDIRNSIHDESIKELFYSRHKNGILIDSTSSSLSTIGTYYRSTPQVTPPTTTTRHAHFRSSGSSGTGQRRSTVSLPFSSTSGYTGSGSSVGTSLAYSLSVLTPLSSLGLSPTVVAPKSERLSDTTRPHPLPVLNTSSVFDYSASGLDDHELDIHSSNRAVIVATILAAISIFTIVGNIMVIWAIFNYRPLHQVQNMYLVSLAVADIAVAVLVMPFNVAYNLLGKWIFGLHLCEMWLTSDV